MYRVVFAILLAGSPVLAQKWVEYRVGPFHLFSDAGNKAARDRLNELEQLRHALGQVLGKDSLGVGGPQEGTLDTVWPVDIILFPNTKAFAPHAPGKPFVEGGSAMLTAWTADTPLPQDLLRAVARMLIDDNADRMPEAIETGLCDLFSTIKAKGTIVSIGAMPDGLLPERLRAWAKVQMLVTSPDYSGKFRVYLNNLQGVGDEVLAARNAYGLTVAKLNEIVDAYVRAGKFEAAQVSAEAINPNRDFIEKPATKEQVDELVAEIAADGKNFPPDSARALIEGRTRDEIELAIKANPKWAEPYFRLSDLEPTDDARIKDLKTATRLEPRNTEYWQELAEAQMLAHQYPDAEKSWASAIREAPNDAERDRIRKVRIGVDEKRAEWEVAERKRIAAEQAAELERIKNAAAAEVHAAEDAAAKKAGGLKPGEKPVAWWGEPEGQKVSGKLTRVDCLSDGPMRLTIDIDGGGVIRLLIRDMNSLQVAGGEPAKFVCGTQRAPREIRVIYNVKTDVKTNTVGEIAMVEFP